MKVTLPSFAKINLGLRIGPLRPDGFHGLRTVYQTIALHDLISVSVGRGSGIEIEIQCDDPRVPTDATNTCYKTVERAMRVLNARARVIVQIEKRLPVQGGLGGASENAVVAMLALEIALKRTLSGAERLRIAAEVGSDLPLFLIGGTVLGVGRGEEVYPLQDLPAIACVIALPEVAVSTPKAFAEWDAFCRGADLSLKGQSREGTAFSRADRTTRAPYGTTESRALPQNHSQANDSASLGMSANKNDKLTAPAHSDRMLEFSREISGWLSAAPVGSGRRSGVSSKSGGRAENPLLDLVRTGIENDFEKVVFPRYPELQEVKGVLERAGAKYASLSGSGSALYGLFDSRVKAAAATKKLNQRGTRAIVTRTLTRRQYWDKLLAISS